MAKLYPMCCKLPKPTCIITKLLQAIGLPLLHQNSLLIPDAAGGRDALPDGGKPVPTP